MDDGRGQKLPIEGGMNVRHAGTQMGNGECRDGPRGVPIMEYAKMMVDELNAYSAEGNLIRNTKSCALKGMQYLHRRSTPITRSTVGISFYDSIVVFEKGQHRRNVPTSSGDIWGDNNNGV